MRIKFDIIVLGVKEDYMRNKQKWISLVLIVILLISQTSVFGGIDPTVSIKVDDVIIELAEAPYVTGGRVLVPL